MDPPSFKPPEGRPPLAIDLNEIPPPPPHCEAPPPPPPPLQTPHLTAEAFAVVFRYHGVLAAPPGLPAPHPGEAGDGRATCGLCGRPEARGATVVCDGCERGFHLACAGICQPRQLGSANEDWVCTECVACGVTKKRWTLGAAKLLDINELPPSEGDGEACQELPGSSANYFRLNNPDGAPFYGLAAQFPIQNTDHLKNAFDLGKGSGIVTASSGRSFEDPNLGSSLGGMPAFTNATVLGHQRGEMIMQSLRDFVKERGAILGEGWHVEFKHSINRSDYVAVYCAPDGKRFESVYDVVHYLGIASEFTPMVLDERVDGPGTLHRSLPPRRRKKDLARTSMANKFVENQDSARKIYCGDLSSDTEAMDLQYCEVGSASGGAKSSMDKNVPDESQKMMVGLPIQYEDFFVISFGKIDLRTPYHGNCQISPVGYKSTWHDKVTGSLFECEVSDGGDYGPVFRVRRCPCSVLPIPNGVTVLIHNKSNANLTGKNECDDMILDATNDNDDNVLLLLSEPDSSELDFSACFSMDYGRTIDGSCTNTQNISTPELNCHLEKSSEPLNMNLRDDIGEFYVEGRSSSAVWKLVSQTLIDTCREVYKQSGCLQFCCSHNSGMLSGDTDSASVNAVDHSLARFCFASGPTNIPRLIQSHVDLEASCDSVAKWIDQDRFGLDVGFVQEIIENLPGSHACYKYHRLSDRSDSSRSCTVGSGLLLPVEKVEGREQVLSGGIYDELKRSSLQHNTTSSIICRPPQGRVLSSRLPAKLIGDVFQVWEMLLRFSDILGLKEPVSFEELEEELMDPWPCNSVKGSEDKKDQSSQGAEIPNESASLAGKSHSAVDGNDSFTFIPVETASMREAAQAKLAAHTYSRCNGLILTKAHTSLLKVLVGELLCKIAVFIDPNFDAKESKSRRGRKRDADNSLLLKETKINILTVNELTWPELARRYVLAVSSMNCCMDSQEVYSRESAKVFRCLQGDGGLLCGSLSGVAGMEADALLLAEAERQLSDPLKRESEVLHLEQKKDSDLAGTSDPVDVNGLSLPDWAQPLEPVKKLPTNVGTRIRRCIYESLERNPPEWAKKILEHSISKEVYKGNASGPTKKAAVSVLMEAYGGKMQQKTDTAEKEKRPMSLSDAIMRRCRIVLRRAASADERKVFCTLLGSTLVNCIDGEDDGVIGLPAMISRPLDFRTIDLRLAVGAYCGFYETFLDDVREVWHNLRMAYGDRPNLMQLVETLAQNFESLYEEEVLSLVQKFISPAGTEHVDPEIQKDLHDILLATNDLPKAPWEDGVCKVCGIDKDDDSVLLCDKCDSEYHRYCLNPPLARIPEGNWYCPSCVASKTQNSCNQAIRSSSRRHLEEGNCAFQECLSHLATVMEEREYWELSMEERIFLLKFLCDEVLNSVLIREHLEQCTDKLSDLQQRLRALYVELRNMKYKEELLAMRVIKESASKISGTSDPARDGTNTVFGSLGRSIGQQEISNKSNYCAFLSGNSQKQAFLSTDDCLGNRQTDAYMNNGKLLNSTVEEQLNGNKVQTSPYGLDYRVNTGDDNAVSSDIFNTSISRKRDKLSGEDGQSVLVSSQQDNDDVLEAVLGGENANAEIRTVVGNNSFYASETNHILDKDINSPMLSNMNILHEACKFSDKNQKNLEGSLSVHVDHEVIMSAVESLPRQNAVQGKQDSACVGISESEASGLELCSLRNEISQLQDCIASIETQLMMTSLRRDFLGRDSFDRLYWLIGRPGKHPWLVVDGSISLSEERKKADGGNSSVDVASKHSLGACNRSNPCLNESIHNPSQWILYESDLEIRELLGWLTDSDPREKELKESILQWQRSGLHKNSNFTDDSRFAPKSSSSETFAASHCLATKAATILEAKYGPCLELEASEVPKRRGRRSKLGCEDKLYRCECLEPVWSSRKHCPLCHQTFCTIIEFEGHNDGKCTTNTHAFDENKENDESMKGKGLKSDRTRDKEHFDEVDNVETSKNGKLEASSKFVKPRKKASPYDIDEINKTFKVKGSLKDLVQEIGLIGSNGVPSFVPSPVFLFDPPEMLNKTISYDANLPAMDSSGELSILSTQNVGTSSLRGENEKAAEGVTEPSQNFMGNDIDENLLEHQDSVPGCINSGKGAAHMTNRDQGLEITRSCVIPELSLMSLVGKNSEILKRLKMNLLDMEAALPDEALKPSKSQLVKRCSWRAFVKSTDSIFEMVQATILFEGMIKSEYLKNGWWYWSSLTAAAKTQTVSSLALRLYTLDDCLIYTKAQVPASYPAESPRTTNKNGKKRKEMDGGS